MLNLQCWKLLDKLEYLQLRLKKENKLQVYRDDVHTSVHAYFIYTCNVHKIRRQRICHSYTRLYKQVMKRLVSW